MNSAKYLTAFAVGLSSVTMPSAAFAADKPPVVLKPEGGWLLDMGENKCRITRAFGSGDQKSVFYLEQWKPSSRVFFALAGPPVAKFRHDWVAQYSFGPGGDAREFNFSDMTLDVFGKLVGTPSTIVAGQDAAADDSVRKEDARPSGPRGLPALDANGAGAITSLKISQSGRNDVVLELGNLKSVLGAMNVCMEDLVEHWGFDPAEQRTVVSPPEVTNLSTVARLVMEDYPARAQNSGAQANFQLRLTIAADGKVENCALVNQTAAEKFDMEHGPCAIFLRTAKAKPALDAAGKAIRSFYVNTIAYRMR